MCTQCVDDEQREIDFLVMQREAEDEAYALGRYEDELENMGLEGSFLTAADLLRMERDC